MRFQLAAYASFSTAVLRRTSTIEEAFPSRMISMFPNLTGAESYDTSKLASDSFAILAADSNVLVHMETLRRATLYARKDPAAAKDLFARLTAGTKSPQSGGPPALYYFDVGYLAETYKQ